MGQKRNVYVIGKKNRRKEVTRMTKNIKMDLGEIGCDGID
jgi:hypothetical protein